MAKRLLVRDQQGERERLLVGTMTVGRDTRCDISDADPLLSRRHAEFVCRPDSLVVRDLHSRNGVTVNGVRVHEAVLRPGDVVKAARLVMTYLGDHDSIRPPAESSPTIDLPLQQPPPAPPEPPSRRAPASAGAQPSEADLYGRRDQDTVKVPAAARGTSGFDSVPPEDDRTRVLPRRGDQRKGSPSQVAVARMTPATPREPLPEPPGAAAASAVDDTDRTRVIVQQGEVKTDAPVPPPSALRTATQAPAAPAPVLPPVPVEGRPAQASHETPPSTVAPPPEPAPLDEWSLELRPKMAEPLAPPATVAPAPSGGRVLAAVLGLAVLVFALTAVPMMVWMTYHPDAPAVAWNFVVVLGPSLLCSLAAGLGLAWWLRRTAMRG